MRRRNWLVVGFVAAVAAIVIGVASAANGATHRPPHAWAFQTRTARPTTVPRIANATTLVLRLQNTAATYIDNPPTGTSQGDELAVEGQLIQLNGTPAGHLEVHEVITGIGPDMGGRIQLTFTALLAGGQISGIGATRFNTATPALAIIGGTGKYLGAHGEVFVHTGPHRSRLTFLLLSR